MIPSLETKSLAMRRTKGKPDAHYRAEVRNHTPDVTPHR